MSYPSATPSYPGFTPSHTLSVDQHGEQHNSEQTDIIALANKVGTGASTPTSGVILRGNGTGTSTWAQANLSSDVTGLLATTNGGTGTTSTTGTGAVVFGTAPTLSTPTITGAGSWTGGPTIGSPAIGDFTNANHNHQGVSQGGVLNGTNAIANGTIAFQNLLSTIFGGQVLTSTGGAVGSFFYMNLGGIKLFWGSITAVATGGTATITFPTSFFSTVQSGIITAGPVSGTAQVEAVIQSGSSFTTSSLTVALNATTGSGTMPIQVFVIGS